MSNATALHEVSRGLGTYSTRDERGAPEPRVDNRIPLAEVELQWWFTVAEGALGLRGVGYEGGGHTVWDDAKINDTHVDRRRHRHRKGVADARRIGPLVAQMSREAQAIAALAFAARRWSVVRTQADLDPRGDQPSPDTLASLTKRTGRLGTLAGVCLLTKRLRVAWAAREHSNKREAREPTSMELLTFLQDEAQGKSPQKVLRPACAEAEGLLGGAIAEYEVLRRDVADRAFAAETEYFTALRAGRVA